MKVATISGMAQRGGTDDDRRARGEATRRDLVDAGRALFVSQGFFNTSIGELVTTSGVGTRGAFYHHFKDKAELFRAVFEEVERDLTLRSLASPPPGADPWERLTRGLHSFLDAALEPEVQRVILLDGPVVLGWQTLRAIQEGNSIALINEIVRAAIADGVIDDQPVGELTHMLVAALEEAALLVAHATRPAKARQRAARVLDRLLLSFAVEPRKVLRR
jgi:AcrR family transcriptional regulator